MSEGEQKELYVVCREQTNCVIKFSASSSNVVATNFQASKICTARYGKPYSDGEFLKQV
jgi:hypothetical protein